MASNTHLLFLFLYLTLLTPSLQQQCPSGCRCPSGTEVRCSNAGLTAIPPDIPATVEKLFLDGNSISEVNSSHISALPRLKLLYLPRNRLTSVKNFANLPNLEILNLASNNISYVDNDAFENSTKLRYIFLNKNSLTDVPTSLERLDNLQILTLDENNVRTVSAAFFSSLGSIARIDLHNNPWSCDCRLRGLKNWMSETSAEISLRDNITCASPEHLIGRAIDDVHVDDMVCATTATVDNETTKRKTTTTTTLTTTDVDVHSTRTTVYSSPSAKAVANTDRATDTHSATLSTQHHTTTTGSEEDQYSRIMNATKPLIPFKSTSGNRVVSSQTGKEDDDKDDLKWIIPVAVLGAAVVVLLIFALKYLSKRY
ncbi:trophoblast glycoprotein-like, partial [Branchiostoma floridae x Branchiostoma belcheri]